jgi:peptide/nickel transport system substrate-binding protein
MLPIRTRNVVMKLVACVAVTAATMGVGTTTAGARQGKPVTFTVGTIQDIDSLNVTLGFLVVDFEIWNNTLPTLTNKAAADFAIEPGLATSWKQSDDGLTVTYTLRGGMKWSDGEPLTAEDVAYTINRSRDEEWGNHTSTTGNLTAEAPDATTVIVTSSVPDPKLPILDVYILPKHVYEKISAADMATYAADDNVSGGPFMIVERKEGEFVHLERNPNFYGQQPAIEQLFFRFFADSEAQYTALKAGDIDAVDDVPEAVYATLKAGGDVAPIGGNQGSFRELAMNNGCESGVGDGHVALRDKHVRQAINWAIDRKLLLDKTANGFGSVGLGIGVSADPSWDLVVPESEQFGFDPDKAKGLLDAAGWTDADRDGVREKDGVSLKLRYNDRSVGGGTEVTPFITKWLSDVGIATEVTTLDEDSLIAQVGKGEYDLFFWGWTPYVDPDPMLSYFTTDQVTTDPEVPKSNDANWCNAAYDEMYVQQKQELDPVKRREIVQKMLRLFYNEAAYAVLYKYDDLMAIRGDRWDGFEEARQPGTTGPALFNNTSPAYLTIRPKGTGVGGVSTTGPIAGTDGVSGVSSTGPPPGTGGGSGVSAVGGVLGVGAFALILRRGRRRGTADDRE